MILIAILVVFALIIFICMYEDKQDISFNAKDAANMVSPKTLKRGKKDLIMTKQEFLDKENEFNQSNDTDAVKFYHHNIIMKIFDEQEDEISKTLEMGREGLIKVSSDLLNEKTKKIEQIAHSCVLEMKEKFKKQYEKEHKIKVTFEGADSEEGEQVFTLPDQLDELIENVHNYAVHNCDFYVNGKSYLGL